MSAWQALYIWVYERERTIILFSVINAITRLTVACIFNWSNRSRTQVEVIGIVDDNEDYSANIDDTNIVFNHDTILSDNNVINDSSDDQDDDGDENMEKEKTPDNSTKKVQSNKRQQMVVPENWPFRGARKLFQQPFVLENEITENDLKMKEERQKLAKKNSPRQYRKRSSNNDEIKNYAQKAREERFRRMLGEDNNGN